MKTKLADKVLEGNVLAAARLMRELEDEAPSAVEELKNLYSSTGRAYIVGVTGAPGAGKSTLIGSLIGIFRKQGMTVGVVAVDPTSPFTNGAIFTGVGALIDATAEPYVYIQNNEGAAFAVGALSTGVILMQKWYPASANWE